MLDILKGLTVELVASGLVGLIMVGVVARNAILGFIEARAKLHAVDKSGPPFTTVASVIWDKDQIERFLQTMENIAEVLEMQARNMEAIAKAQGIMSDNFQQTTQSKLNNILERLAEAEERKPSRPRPRRKPKSTP